MNVLEEKLKIVTGLFLIVLLASCSTTKLTQKQRNAMNSWMGAHKSELIQSWGPPERYEPDGKGGQILIYESSQTRGAVINNTYYEKTMHPYKMFYVNSDGRIYYWRTGTD